MQFMTPPNHTGFKAAILFGESGKIIDGAVAYIDAGGGGPIVKHTHSHNHLFSVIEGEAKILLGEETVILKRGDSFLVEGSIPHSVWNNCDRQTVMIGISVK